jgi:hypothetical protein
MGNPIMAIDPDGNFSAPPTDFVNAETGQYQHVEDGSNDIVIIGPEQYKSILAITMKKTWTQIDSERYFNIIDGGDNYAQNDFGVYKFPESGRGFDRYSTNWNNENYYTNGVHHTGDGYASREGFLALYKTFVEFYNETGVTSHYGDISAFDPRIQLGHSTHFRGSAVDIHYFDSNGKELTQDNAYRNASVSRVNAFFSIAEANGFTSNYSYGNRFMHSGNTNHFMHDDHFHIGLPDSNKYSRKNVKYGMKSNVPLP